ncbi:MAG: tRNA dihydrouridine synthase DusB [Lachnospiraceae bacterium]|nr:tRNA dihydrouridine synthase DusB [Lachnospiraceae bacterium]
MAGVTDRTFRRLCREQGADLLYTEMVSAKGLHYRSKNTADLLRTDDGEKPIGVQLFGSEPEIMAEAAAMPLLEAFDFIDINMGCPVPKVVNNGEGSALMKDPKLARQIVASVVSAAAGRPVTAKIRKGIGEYINTAEFARYLEDGGVSCIAVHGRTREQYYSGRSDWGTIRAVKEAVSVPVIGSGDVTTPQEALRMLDETGCDGVMIARAAQGDPWIFGRVRQYLAEKGKYGKKENIEKSGKTEYFPDTDGQDNNTSKNEKTEKPDFETVLAMIHRHAELLVQEKGEWTAVRELRKHVAWYTQGYPGSARLRNEINLCESMHALFDRLDIYNEERTGE